MEAPRWHDPRLTGTRTLDTPMPPPAPRDRSAWEERARELRLQVLAAAGIWADPALTPRQAPRGEIFERREHPELGYAVEKVYFESLPGHHVTGNLYRPLGRSGRRPAVLHPHGHAANGRLQHDRLFSPALRCITFARMGYVAFAHDMAGYGDNLRIPHRWGDAEAWLWGATPLGLQLWNSIRALDFLAALPDVDPERLGCTGESGGGTQTFLLTAVDPRVRVSAPVNMVSLHMQGGCVCENAPGLRLDTTNVEIAALAAPRPLLLVAATGDWTVNTPHLEFPAVAAIYGLYGEETRRRVESVRFEAVHNYNRQSREAVYDFFRRWLPADGGAVPSEDDIPGPDAEEDLRVFARRPWPAGPEGEAAVENVVRQFQLRAETALEDAAQGDAAGVGRLRQTLLPRLQAVTGVGPVAADAVRATPEGDLIWLARRGRQELFAVRRLVAGGSAPEGAALLEGLDGTLFAVHPFGGGARSSPWARSGRAAETPHFLCYNRTDAAWQAQDLLTALAWLGGGAARLSVGPELAVAALLARAIAGTALRALEVTLGPEWAGQGWTAPGNYLPGVLRAGGLAGLLALAAPGAVRLGGGRVLGAGALFGVRALYAALDASGALTME